MVQEAFALGVVLSLKDSMTSGIKNAMGQVSKFTGAVNDADLAVKRLDKATFQFGAAMGAMKFLTPIISESATFEKSLSGLQAVSNATATELTALKDAAIDAGIKTKFSPDQAAEGLTALAASGFSATESIKNLLPVLDFAAASGGKLNMDSAASAIASTVQVFKESAGHIADVYVTMSNISSFSPEDMQATWAGVNQVQAQAQQSVETMGAVLSALKNSGQTAVGSGEKLRMAVNSLITPSRMATAELEKLKVSAYDTATGKFRDIIDIFQDLQAATASMADKDRNAALEKILSTEGMAAFNAVSSIGIDKVREFKTQMDNSDGAVRKFAETQQNNAVGAVEMFKGSVSTLAILLGQSLLPAITGVVRGFTLMLSPVLEFLRTHPKVASFFAVFAIGFAIILGGLAVYNSLSGAILGVSVMLGIAKGSTYTYLISQIAAGIATGNLGTVSAATSLLMNQLGIVTIWNTGKNYALAASQYALGLATTVGMFAVMGFNAVGTGFAAILNLMGLSTAAATVKTWLFNSALLANPITWIVIGVVLLVGALALLIYKWDVVKAAVKNVWENHKGLAFIITGALMPALIPLLGTVYFLSENWGWVAEKAASAWEWMQRAAGVDESTFAVKKADALRKELDVLKEREMNLKSQGLAETDMYKSAVQLIADKTAQLKAYESAAQSMLANEKAIASLNERKKSLSVELSATASIADQTKIKSMISDIDSELKSISEGAVTPAINSAIAELQGSKEKLKTEATATGQAVSSGLTDGILNGSGLDQAQLTAISQSQYTIAPPKMADPAALNQNVNRKESLTNMFKIEIQNMVGELIVNKQSQKVRLPDIGGMIERLIQEQIEKLGKNGATAQ